MNWTATRVRALREHMGLSQTDFADRLGFARYQTVSDLETGRRDVTDTVSRLLDYMAREAGFEQTAQAGGVDAARVQLGVARQALDQVARTLDAL